jgi:glycosyltransferase involved in cell wall biosynthesis
MEGVPTRLESDGAASAVSVVVPVFNADRTLKELHRRIAATISAMSGLSSWELILVNDGSADQSWERIVGLSGEHAEVRGLDLDRNFGQHNALLAGIHAARHEVIVTLDDDLQNPPEEIPKLLGALRPDLDVVYGAPISNRHPAHRRIGAIAVRTFLRVVTRRPAHVVASGFRALRSDLTEQLPEAGGRHIALDSTLRARTDRIGATEVNHERRQVGRSNYSLLMLGRLALTTIASDLRLKGRRAQRGPSYEVRAVTGSEPADDDRR